MSRIVLAALVALALATPGAAGSWRAWGTYEPDTALDDPTFMRSEPNRDARARLLYFNAYATENGVVNPNNGLVGTQILVPGSRVYAAMLGVWTDCNDDGYVGAAETLVVVYRAEALLDDGLCPPGSAHHAGAWIYEYIPVGRQHGENPPTPHPIQIDDPEARVWGDFGVPGAGASSTCAVAPLPHGTTSGSGWMLRYADCLTGKRVTAAIQALDPDGANGIGFGDPNDPQRSDSILNQHFPESLFGNPATDETGALQLDSEEDGGAEEAAFSTWDCDGRAFELRDPTGLAPDEAAGERLRDEDGRYAWLAEPAPELGDPRASFADGLNATFRGFRVGGGDENADPTVGGDCDTQGDDPDGDNTYSTLHQTALGYADGAHTGSFQTPAKARSDVRFAFSNGAPSPALYEPISAGRHPVNFGLLQSSASWGGQGFTTAPQSVDRTTLRIEGGLYFTFYAKVGRSTTDAGYRTPGGAGEYGIEACGDHEAGMHGGWQCEPALWWRDAGGNDIATVWDVRPGASYQLRDVDCADGEVARGSGVYASLAFLSDDRVCEDAG